MSQTPPDRERTTPEPGIRIVLPAWLGERAAGAPPAAAEDAAKVRFVSALADENVRRGTGGPFAAAVYRLDGGPPVALGVNMVVPAGSSILHGEIVALVAAQQRLGTYTLAVPGGAAHELITSCEPCAMCLGATLWSGVRRLVCGATKEDAERVGFDEGPVSAESWSYLERRGIQVVRGVARAEAAAVLDRYAAGGGLIYNAAGEAPGTAGEGPATTPGGRSS